MDRRTTAALPTRLGTTRAILLGCGLYYGVLLFNLAVTFWIGERLLGMVGIMIFLPITVLAVLRLIRCTDNPRIV